MSFVVKPEDFFDLTHRQSSFRHVISFPVQEITRLGQLPCANPPTPVDSARY